MRLPRLWLLVAALSGALPVELLMAQRQRAPSDVPTFRVSSNLVFLDVTVLDKKGRPVTKGLSKDDFTITEHNRPQHIFSFEGPEKHVMDPDNGDSNAEGEAPLAILVLDLLNSKFEDFAYIRYEVRQFLIAQPPQLSSPVELMVVGNQSLEVLQGYTRDRADLLYALENMPPALPFKKMDSSFFAERFGQSIDALDQIALQNRGVPGRKNILWVGHGGPNLFLQRNDIAPSAADEIKQYVHFTINMMVEARISLFVIYPDLPVWGRNSAFSAMQSTVDIGDDDPFSGDINFGLFVDATGGKLFYDRNDVDAEIQRSEKMGSDYYTLTYQPRDVPQDGRFRRIRVTLRERSLRAVTKVGYFAPQQNGLTDGRLQNTMRLTEAVQSTIPFNALNVSLSGIVRHPDTRSVEFTAELKSKDLAFVMTGDGQSAAHLIFAAASLSANQSILVSRIVPVSLLPTGRHPSPMPNVVSRVHFMMRVPRDTQSLRVVVENLDDGRIGAAFVDRKALNAEPAMATPKPELTVRPPEGVNGAPRPNP